MDGLMTGKEVQQYLKISRSMLHRLVKEGRLPIRRIGTRAVRYKRADVDALVEGGEPQGGG